MRSLRGPWGLALVALAACHPLPSGPAVAPEPTAPLAAAAPPTSGQPSGPATGAAPPLAAFARWASPAPAPLAWPSTTAPAPTPPTTAASPAPQPTRSPTFSAPSQADRNPLHNMGHLAELLSERGIRAHLDTLLPAIKRRLVQEAGGEQQLVDYLARAGTRIPFQRLMPVTGLDVFTYDRTQATVLTFPAITTVANEVFPLPTVFGRYLVYNTDRAGNWDIVRYDTQTQKVSGLSTVNTRANETFATVNLTGRWMSFVEGTPEGPRLRFYDFETKQKFVPAVEEAAHQDCRTPVMSPLGGKVAFSTPVNGQLDLRVYDVLTAQDVTPPFVNSDQDELLASFSLDGTQLLFVSKREGRRRIYLADFSTGVVEPLVLTASQAAEVFPFFITLNEIAFYSTRTQELACYAYRLDTHELDTMPYCGKNLPGGPPPLGLVDLEP